MDIKDHMPDVPKQRSSNMELLRIVAMLVIVANHCITHGRIPFPYDGWSFNRMMSHFLNNGQLGVSLFVLITGYFQCQSVFKFGKLVKLWGQVVFYAFGLYLVFVLAGRTSFSALGVFHHVMPIVNRQYWFITAYVGMYLFSTALNAFLQSASRGLHLRTIATCVLLFSFVPTVFHSDPFGGGARGVPWMCALYLTGAYFRLHPDAKLLSPKVAAAGAAAMLVVVLASEAVLDLLAVSNANLVPWVQYVANQPSRTPLYLLSVFLFAVFANLKLRHVPWINFVASSTLGVYLIHDYALMRRFLWVETFRFRTCFDSPLFVPYLLACALLVFAACVAVDKIRGGLVSVLARTFSRRKNGETLQPRP